MVSISITSEWFKNNWIWIGFILIVFFIFIISRKRKKYEIVREEEPEPTYTPNLKLPSLKELEKRQMELEKIIHKRSVEYEKWISESELLQQEYEHCLRMIKALRQDAAKN